MAEFLSSFQVSVGDESYSISVVLGRLLLAVFAGAVVAWLSRSTADARTDDTLPMTLVFLSVLIAMATQIIGDNVARAFSLVGALSIVRFRTAVPQTRDVAFVLAAVVVGMALGAGQYLVAFSGLCVIVVVVAVTHRVNISHRAKVQQRAQTPVDLVDMDLTVGPAAVDTVQEAIEKICRWNKLVGAETAKKGTAIRLRYQAELLPAMPKTSALLNLQQIATVDSVEIHES